MSIEDKNKWYKIYLGEYYEYFINTTKQHVDYFRTLNLDLNKSYLINCSDPQTLKYFITYYVCAKDCNFQTYLADEYVSDICNRDKESIVDNEVLVLYYHKGITTYTDKQDNWLHSTLLGKITGRNRKNLITIVLAETPIPILENSRELEILKLSTLKSSKEDSSKLIITNTVSNGGTVY